MSSTFFFFIEDNCNIINYCLANFEERGKVVLVQKNTKKINKMFKITFYFTIK